MFPSTYTLGNQTQQPNTATTTLHRENTDEISKMFTTLYDGDSINTSNNCNSSNIDCNSNNNIDFIQEYFLQHQQLRQHSSDTSSFFHTTPTSMSNPAPWNMFTPTPVSPASPTSSCFSSSGNDTETESDSLYSSPALALLPYPTNSAANTSIDAMMVDLDEDSVEYSDLFSRIEGHFLNNPSTIDEIAAVVAAASAGGNGDVYQYPAAEVALFTEHLREQEEEAKKSCQHRHRHTKGKEALHISNNAEPHPYNNYNRTTGGPQRSSSLSPTISFAPYISPIISCASLSRNQQQHNDNHYYLNQLQQQEFNVKQEQDHDDDDAMSTYSSSSSLSSAPSSRAGSPEISNGIDTITSSSDGTTTITNQKDGSIMCFNRTTGTVSFRCDLCPTQQQSFGRIHDLKRHQATKHATSEGGPTKTWPCEFCEKPFARRDALLRHYSVKAARGDGVHPGKEEADVLAAVRARAKLI
ncbi:MAG: hypothetical protein JOS17DRAFT_768222 [Linnemannia elongata]|nr:MAG: hypothetical protein JOS17DRAFT_768222 [Linnemannia elongata]